MNLDKQKLSASSIQIAKMLEKEPRRTLTSISTELKLPICFVFDRVVELENKFKFTGKWNKR